MSTDPIKHEILRHRLSQVSNLAFGLAGFLIGASLNDLGYTFFPRRHDAVHVAMIAVVMLLTWLTLRKQKQYLNAMEANLDENAREFLKQLKPKGGW